MKCFANTIKSRRERLLSLALRKLPKTAVQSLNLDSSRLLDADAYILASMLKDNGIKLPACLEPGKITVFHSFHINCSRGGLQLANILYETGFQEIDALDDQGMTPLQRLAGDNHKSGSGSSTPRVLAMQWLIEHGADINKSFGLDSGPLIFYLASTYSTTNTAMGEDDFTSWVWSYDCALDPLSSDGRGSPEANCSLTIDSTRTNDLAACVADGSDDGDEEEELSLSANDQEDDFSDVSSAYDDDTGEESSDSGTTERCHRRDLLSMVSKLSDTLNDTCKCYCSINGCLPVHMFPVLSQGSVKTWGQIQDDLFFWIEDCGISDNQARSYINAACRLEIFERLAMVHTCCRRNVSYKLATMSQETRKKVQAEDIISTEQLELIMDAFTRAMESRAAWSLWEFWKWWWKITDFILPPLLPWERGLRYCRPNRPIPRALTLHLLDISAHRFQRSLEIAGYKDESFTDIVQKHLAKFLNDDQQEAIHMKQLESSSSSFENIENDVDPPQTELKSRRKTKRQTSGGREVITQLVFHMAVMEEGGVLHMVIDHHE